MTVEPAPCSCVFVPYVAWWRRRAIVYDVTRTHNDQCPVHRFTPPDDEQRAH